MNTEEFLRQVLPEQGIYCLAISHPKTGMSHRFVDSIEALSEQCLNHDAKNDNVYYCVSSLSAKRRLKDNVVQTRILFVDVDCGDGKPYANWREGLKATGDFVSAMGLPKPLIVSSGNGLHIYWILNDNPSREEWSDLAIALKEAAIQNDFNADYGIMGDSARLLRPVGTRNTKNGKTVRALIQGEETTSTWMGSLLARYMSPMKPPVIEPKKVDSKLLDAIKIETQYSKPNPAAIQEKCRQVSWAIANPNKVDEPLWHAVIGLAAFCDNPEQTAVSWSKGYGGFDEKETIAKIKQWQSAVTGPTTCDRFNTVKARGCVDCPVRGKITTPAQLGVQYKEVSAPPDAPDNPSNILEMPKPFKRTRNGIKMTVDGTDIAVCDFDLYPVGYGYDESLGYEVVRFKWKRPHHGWVDLILRQAHLADGSREFPTAIADQGIVLYDKHKTHLFQAMSRAYINELKRLASMTNLYSTMGWKEGNTSFVIGNVFIKRLDDGSVSRQVIDVSNTIRRQSAEFYKTKGESYDVWRNMTGILEQGKFYAHMFVLGVGFSAPLYNFTGLKGITISLYGPTGGGKSLAQLWAQSIYGNPDKLHFSAKYTQYSLFSRLGMYCNLPMTIDEVTMMDDKDVGDFCYWVTQGADKVRLDRNADERDTKTWAAPVIVSTNVSMHSKLIAAKTDTDAQMMRLLEIQVPVYTRFQESNKLGRKIYELIHNCYGHTGKEYISRLLEMGEDKLREKIKEANKAFSKKYCVNFSGQERYWEQAIVLADLGGQLAQDWGLIDYDYQRGTRWVLEQMGAIRTTVGEGAADAYDLLAMYMQEYGATILTIYHRPNGETWFVDYRLPRADVRIRMDMYQNRVSYQMDANEYDRGTMMIDRTHFRTWLSSKGRDYKSFKEAIAGDSADATPRSNKFSMGKGTPIKIAQSYVIGINLAHPRLSHLLEGPKQRSELDDNVYGDIHAV